MPIEHDQLENTLPVAKGFAEERVVVANRIPGGWGRGGQLPIDLLQQLRGGFLIGVDVEDPVMCKRKVLQAPLLFLGVLAVPPEIHDRSAELAGDLLRAIGAAGIDDKDLIDALQ